MGPDFKLSLKAARINAGFEAREVAEKIGVAKLTVYHWENGTAMPSLKVAQKLCDLYGLGLGDIDFFRKGKELKD
jgi:Predicted transcriptional regulators|nr:MAG TPA: Helix-turn-helix XRE-family like protein [Caudoviricetes sp.]